MGSHVTQAVNIPEAHVGITYLAQLLHTAHNSLSLHPLESLSHLKVQLTQKGFHSGLNLVQKGLSGPSLLPPHLTYACTPYDLLCLCS